MLMTNVGDGFGPLRHQNPLSNISVGHQHSKDVPNTEIPGLQKSSYPMLEAVNDEIARGDLTED